jgi:TATA-binding protein-associated factor
MPNFLGSESAFSAEFAKPITKGQLPGATAIAINESMEKLKILHQQCLPFILRREKEQVLKELPPKITSDIKVPMTALQSKVYQSFLNRPVGQAAHEKLQSIVDTDRSEHEVLSLSRDVLKSILFMRLVCTHPALVTCQREDNETERIGFEASGKLLALVEILRSAGIYDEDSITGADNDTSLLYCEDDSKNGNAFESFVQSVDATMTASSDFGSRLYDKKSKCIIFAQFSKSLDVVENMVLKRLMPSVQYVRLDGSVPAEKRADVATTFNCNSNVRLILATTRVGGLGLNLTGKSWRID